MTVAKPCIDCKTTAAKSARIHRCRACTAWWKAYWAKADERAELREAWGEFRVSKQAARTA